MTIGDWRERIDEIDDVVVQLLNLRTSFALEVARLKEEEGLSLCVPEREQEVLASVKRLNDGPLDDEAITKIFRAIMDESRRIQGLESGSAGERPRSSEAPKSRPVGKRRSG